MSAYIYAGPIIFAIYPFITDSINCIPPAVAKETNDLGYLSRKLVRLILVKECHQSIAIRSKAWVSLRKVRLEMEFFFKGFNHSRRVGSSPENLQASDGFCSVVYVDHEIGGLERAMLILIP
jgi:hypothetical protein